MGTHLAPGRQGAGLTVEVPLTVPIGSLGYWSDRLARYGVALGVAQTRFGEKALAFRDPHGLELSLVESDDPPDFPPWRSGPVPEAQQLRGIHGAKAHQRELAPTARFLTEVLGLKLLAQEGGWHRFGVGMAGYGSWHLAQQHTGRFAALAPSWGGGTPPWPGG